MDEHSFLDALELTCQPATLYSPLGSRDVSRDPLNKVRRVLGLDVLDLLLDLLHRDLTTVDTVDGEVSLAHVSMVSG